MHQLRRGTMLLSSVCPVSQCSHRGAGSSPRIPNTFEAPKTEVGPIKYISDDRVIGPRVTAFGASIFRRAATLTNRLFSVRPRGLVCEPRLGKRERDRRPSSSLFLPSPAPPPCRRKLLKFLGATPIAAIFPGVRLGAVQYLILMCFVLQCLTQIKMRQLMMAGARLTVIFARNVDNAILTCCAMQQLMNAASQHKFSS